VLLARFAKLRRALSLAMIVRIDNSVDLYATAWRNICLGTMVALTSGERADVGAFKLRYTGVFLMIYVRFASVLTSWKAFSRKQRKKQNTPKLLYLKLNDNQLTTYWSCVLSFLLPDCSLVLLQNATEDGVVK